MKPLAYYVTAHGYGHGTRSCDIINALLRCAPDLQITVKTDLPRSFLSSRIPIERVDVVQAAFDTGLIQKDSIRVDLPASLHAVEEIYRQEPELLKSEAEYLRTKNVGAVVADLPSIPLKAAIQSDIPSIAVGNFGWDWIYEEFAEQDPRWRIFVEGIRSVYAQTDLLIRIPFAEEMSAFPRQMDVPILAHPGKNQRQEMADFLKADPSKRWILLSFTSLDWNPEAVKKVVDLSDYQFFSIDPLRWDNSGIYCIDRAQFHFSDVVASVDAVLTKPGFGILSECVANRKPIIYADRKNFREYPVLVECIRKYLQHAFIPAADLYAGNLEKALDAVSHAPVAPEQIALGGDIAAAEAILNFLR